MAIGWLVLKDPEFESLTLVRSQTYPHEMRLHLRVKYKGATLQRSGQQDIEYVGGFHILQSKGHLELSRSNAKSTINANILNVWHSGPRDVKLLSEPLSLKEIHEIDEELGSGDIQVYWSLDAWGFLEDSAVAKYGVSSALVSVRISSPRRYVIGRQNFVKNVLEPADMLRRMFIEVIVEPVDKLDRIKNPDVRKILKILLGKQKILVEAYTKFINARNSADYRSVINDVRLAVEGLNANEIRNVLKGAYEALGIAEETFPGALTKVADEVSSVLIGQRGSRGIMGVVYKFTCKLAPHAKTEDDQHYIPRPSKRDAEFALLHVLGTLNYLIKILKIYTLRA